MVRECLEAGFPSVMIDGSHLPFEQNVALTRRAVELARSYGAAVEGELGALGRTDGLLGEGNNGESSLTDPSEAREFTQRTGVDALAVSVGNAHGLYRSKPDLDFGRLQEILDTVDVPVVLHGGTGIPKDQFSRAIAMGMCKVNVATELVLCYSDAMKQALAEMNGSIWPATVLQDVKHRMTSVVRRWINELGSAGKAGVIAAHNAESPRWAASGAAHG
jgi:ketose-bisphosphate aldolase